MSPTRKGVRPAPPPPPNKKTRRRRCRLYHNHHQSVHHLHHHRQQQQHRRHRRTEIIIIIIVIVIIIIIVIIVATGIIIIIIIIIIISAFASLECSGALALEGRETPPTRRLVVAAGGRGGGPRNVANSVGCFVFALVVFGCCPPTAFSSVFLVGARAALCGLGAFWAARAASVMRRLCGGCAPLHLLAKRLPDKTNFISC